MTDPFIASNGIEISGGDGLFIRDPKARNSEARMMTIQARKTLALKEYFESQSWNEGYRAGRADVNSPCLDKEF